MIAGNVFHRAVALGELQSRLPNEVEARLVVNGETGDVAPAPEGTQLVPRLAAAVRILTAAGERMRAGEVVITGNVVQVPVAPGDEVVAEFSGLGAVGLRITP